MSWAELLPSAVRYLRDSDSFRAETEGLLGHDEVGGSFASGWIFQGLKKDGAPYRTVEGSGYCCIVLTDRSSHHGSAWHTNNFPRLQVSIFADVSRDEAGNPVASDAEYKAKKMYEAVDRMFHNPANNVHDWSGLTILSSIRSDFPSIVDVFDGDSAVRLTVAYDISLI